MRKEKLREVKWLAQDHEERKQVSWDEDPVHLILETAFLTTYTFRSSLPKLLGKRDLQREV